MTFVVDYYLRTIKENVLRGIYSKDWILWTRKTGGK
jgi:hypothetical protein